MSIIQETMSNEHAMRFPFVGSAMLLSLFLLFKFLSKDLVNAVLTCYFFVLGIIALSYVLSIWICYYCFTFIQIVQTNVLFFCIVISFILSAIVLRATILPAMKRFLPKHWNEDLIIWRFPYFRCMPLLYYSFEVYFEFYLL